MLILDTFICNDHFPKPIVLLLVPVSTIQSHRHELLPHHQGQRLGLHWRDTAPSPQQRRGAHLEIEVVEGEGQSVGILQRHTWSLAPFNLLPPDWCHFCGDQNYKKQDKRLLDGTLPPLVLLLVLCNCRDSQPQDRTAATTHTPTLAVLQYTAGTSSHSNTCGAHAVCSIALSKQTA